MHFDTDGNIISRNSAYNPADRDKKYDVQTSAQIHGKQVELVVPRPGDYMVATKQHYISIINSGLLDLWGPEPHDRMDIMYIKDKTISQCSWGSPAQKNGRPIHSTWPGQWHLGLTPLDNDIKHYEEPTEFCKVKDN